MNKKESSFQFTNPKISELMFAPTGEDVPSNLTDILPKVNINSEVEKVDDQNSATVTLTLSNFNREDLESNSAVKLPYLMRIGYSADFKWDKGISSKDVESFLKVNAQALLFGYLRPEVSELTSRSGFETINLPFLDFTNSEKE